MARIVRLRGIVCTLAAGGVALAAPVAYGASAGFSGNVCKILTKSQVATLHVPTSCAQLKPTKSSLGTVTTAVWGVGKITGPDVSVAVWKVTNSAFLPALEASHAQGKSVGVGSWSRSEGPANGKTADSIGFVKDGYFVIVIVNTGPKHPLPSAAPFVALAKIVAKAV